MKLNCPYCGGSMISISDGSSIVLCPMCKKDITEAIKTAHDARGCCSGKRISDFSILDSERIEL